MPDAYHPDSIRAQVQKILATAPMAASPSLSRFLRHVVDETLAGRTDGLREQVLGRTVFERGENFNPRSDPIVRVQARNLRARLTQYYEGPGAHDPIVIELPKGAYVPIFHIAKLETATGAASPSPASEGPAASTARRRLLGPGLVVAALAAAALWVGISHLPLSTAAHVPDPVAQDLYIHGRFRMDRETEPALREAVDAFNRAIARDPKFAAAHAGLSEAYNLLAQLGYISPREGMEHARSAAQQAIKLDSRLAEGHVALAAVIEAYDWDWCGAEREYRRALQLNPALPAAHLWYGAFLRDQGRLGEALPELRRAAELQPFSVLTNLNLAHALILEGNFSNAATLAKRASEIAPELATAHVLLSRAYQADSQPRESEAALERASGSAKDNPHALAMLACAYARIGKAQQGTQFLRELERLSQARYVSPYDLGAAALSLGEEDRAISLFEEALRQRSSGLIFLRNSKQVSARASERLNSIIDKLHMQG